VKPQHDHPELPLPQTKPSQRLGRQRRYL
jgi:hypothetical protein